jgi:DNA-binding Xre family transcriptional regulator
MNRITPEWAKDAKKIMIDLDMSVTELADAIGMTRIYVSSVLHGRVISPPAQEKICSYLETVKAA